MRKKFLAVLLLIGLLIACVFTLFACDNLGDKNEDSKTTHVHTRSEWIIDSEPTEKTKGSKHIECTNCHKVIKTAEIDNLVKEYLNKLDDGNYYGKVYNSTFTFCFDNKIDKEEGFSSFGYEIYTDNNYQNKIVNNTAVLNVGDNVFYMIYGGFRDGVGGIVAVSVEEDFYLKVPTEETFREGYVFDKWDFDFTTPITENKEIFALWTPNVNIPYKVEYCYENQNDNYAIDIFLAGNLTSIVDNTARVNTKDLTFTDYNFYIWNKKETF
ncbi:MAG: hypothetical protein MJ066_06505 [Clostridia bacterium]|nr:hypothetical protein [Clostridia bacterium]